MSFLSVYIYYHALAIFNKTRTLSSDDLVLAVAFLSHSDWTLIKVTQTALHSIKVNNLMIEDS